MQIIVATKTSILKESVASKFGQVETPSTKSELTRLITESGNKLIIITDDFDKSLDVKKFLKTYASASNFVVFATEKEGVKFPSPFVRIYNNSLNSDDLEEISHDAGAHFDRVKRSLPPQISEIKVVSVWSTNPRNLKTTTALNLAGMLAKNNPEDKVMLLGMNINNPTLPNLLRSNNNSSELLIPTIENGFVDPSLLDGVTYRYPDMPNLHVIAGIDDTMLFHKIDINFVDNLLSALKEKYKYIIIDTGSYLTSLPTIASLQNSDLVVNIIDKDLSTFTYGWENAKKMMKSLGIDLNKMVAVLNEFYTNDDYDNEAIWEYIDLYNMGSIPNLGASVQHSALRKTFVISGSDDDKALKKYERLLGQLFTYITKEKPGEKKSWFSNIFGG